MYSNKKIELERILSQFKLSGPYYVKLFSLLIFSAVTNAFYTVNYIFAAADVGYRCKYSECEGKESDFAVLPFNLTDRNRCTRYAFLGDQNCTSDNIDTKHIVRCSEWIYETPHSFVEEMQIECQDLKRTMVGTVHSFGYMIGLLIVGPVADKIGRKKLIIFSGIIAATIGVSKSFTSSYWVYIVLELLEALFGDTYSTTFMLGVEMVTKENRVTFVTIMTASTSLAGMAMALIAWLLPHWRHFLQAIYGPALFFIFYIFLLDESVRWLLSKGKENEAKDILKRAAKINKAVINEDTLSVKCEDAPNKTNMIALLKITFGSKKLSMRFLACVCMWITILFNKYVLLINSVELEGNKYLNFGLTTFTELPASFVLAYILKRFKRKMPLLSSFLLTGVFCVAQSLVPKVSLLKTNKHQPEGCGFLVVCDNLDHITLIVIGTMECNPWLSTSLFLIGKFMATISYATVYLYTSELFPTYTRNTMHAICSSMGRIAAILAPQTPLLMLYWTGLPSLIVGGLSLFTAFIVILMPETSEDALPDTVREAEAVGTKTPAPENPATICTKL